MKEATKRSIFRWVHIVCGVPMLGYIDDSPSNTPNYAFTEGVADFWRANRETRGGDRTRSLGRGRRDGTREGDVIEEVNRKPVRDFEQFRHELTASGNQSVRLLVNRGGTTQFAVVGR
jgi:S1-C subfamily serine protease